FQQGTHRSRSRLGRLAIAAALDRTGCRPRCGPSPRKRDHMPPRASSLLTDTFRAPLANFFFTASTSSAIAAGTAGPNALLCEYFRSAPEPAGESKPYIASSGLIVPSLIALAAAAYMVSQSSIVAVTTFSGAAAT